MDSRAGTDAGVQLGKNFCGPVYLRRGNGAFALTWAGNFNWVKGLPLNTANLDIVIDAYNTFFISGSYGNINGAAIDMDPGAGVAALTIPGGLPPPYYNAGQI
ncbi:MAG: hypothetical protein IPP46_05495 [Bacteroidetes bacterium]|nr:hypothetical protein [Bacteroidota bacterium]